MKVDYIIVGLGIAGITFADKLETEGKTFVVFDDMSQQASIVASGMYNPVVLKRFTPVWQSKEQLEVALPFYRGLEEKFSIKLDYNLPIARVFKSVEEQNNWFEVCDRHLLNDYMCQDLVANTNTEFMAPFKLGMLKNTGRIDTKLLISTYRNYLESKGQLFSEKFDYNTLFLDKTSVKYHNVIAKKLVFCEGFGMLKNPFFNTLPMQESKGELITIFAPKLNVDFMLKGPVFIMPLGNHQYKVGATFNWKDKTNNPTEEGKKELLDKLGSILTTDYEIVSHVAGVRPTVKDRRPLLGKHPTYKNLSLFNGLGTRGVMIAPYAANFLYEHLEKNNNLPQDLAIYRF
ncbi:MAG: FAD-binding oxidoreductase [Flavobacteriales bacterium]|nr:FAD-binding oxidoreductase [Flavobacteriales bacterium]